MLTKPMEYKEVTDRIQNSFFSVDHEKVDAIVQFDTVDLDFNIVTVKKNTLICKEYLFSYQNGDLYILWYPYYEQYELDGIQYEEGEFPVEIGYFYVTKDKVYRIVNLNIDGRNVSVYDLDEADFLSEEHSVLVCSEENCFTESGKLQKLCM